MSAVVSRSCLAPLERIKLQRILHRTKGSSLEVAAALVKAEGWRGFWRGNALNLLRTAPYKAVNFASFDLFRRLLLHLSGSQSQSYERFVAGALAGITSTVTCFPLDVLRTRIMGPGGARYSGALRTLRAIVATEGVGALYVGVLPAIISMAPSGAVFYGVYDLLKENHISRQQQKAAEADGLEHPRDRLPPSYMLLYGALAGAAAETAIYPLEIVRRRLQLQSMAAAHAAADAVTASGGAAALQTVRGLNSWRAMGITAMSIFQQEGVRGFYTGLLPNTLQVLPNAALSYFAYETFKTLLQVKE